MLKIIRIFTQFQEQLKKNTNDNKLSKICSAIKPLSANTFQRRIHFEKFKQFWLLSHKHDYILSEFLRQ